jgi:hypothetical protein
MCMKRIDITVDEDTLNLFKAYCIRGMTVSKFLRQSAKCYSENYPPPTFTMDEVVNELNVNPGEICPEHGITYFSCWKKHG